MTAENPRPATPTAHPPSAATDSSTPPPARHATTRESPKPAMQTAPSPSAAMGALNPLSGETCDDAGDSAECDADCTVSMCGDGYTNPEAEEEATLLTTASPTARSESAAVTPPPHGKSSLNPCTTTTQQAPSPTSLTTSSMATGPHPYQSSSGIQSRHPSALQTTRPHSQTALHRPTGTPIASSWAATCLPTAAQKIPTAASRATRPTPRNADCCSSTVRD